MPMEALFDGLIRATTAAEVRTCLANVGDGSEIDIDTSFGPLSLHWHPFGNNLSNISSVGLGTKPGRSITERLTNAIDAVLEARANPSITLPTSSRQAAQQWFGRPATGPDDGLYKWDFDTQKIDRQIQLTLLNSGVETAPTIDVLDSGIGIRPEQFAKTILSLQGGNKLTKRYLIGAFGQGGAATLGFCKYAIVVSRHKDSPQTIGFTVIRVMRLSDEYKEDAYAYLALRVHGEVVVPSVVRSDPIELYTPAGKAKSLAALDKGTLVRHIQYMLPNLAGSLSPSPGNLYQYLHCSMFDPLLPFRAVDLRSSDRARDERVTGARNRLMRLVDLKADEPSEGKVEIRHHRPMEFFSLHPGDGATTGIEYWVVHHYRKSKKAGKDEIVLRSNSVDSFVQPTHPIVGTLNGQNQGEMTARILRELGLGMVARHIVIHIDATNTTPRLRRELFSTNREGFKEGDVMTELERILKELLDEDEELKKIEKELTDRFTKRETEETNKEVKDQITRLLREAGLQVKTEGQVAVEGGTTIDVVEKKRHHRPVNPDPLPTLPYPNVTRFEIVSPQPVMRVRIGDHETLLVETDADAQFDKLGRIALRSEPKVLEEFGKSPLKGGRVRWRLRPVEGAEVGTIGRVVASITRPDGSQIESEVLFEILERKESKGTKEKGLVPPFQVIPVSPDEDEKWTMLWPNLGEGADADELATVAYKPWNAGGEIHVYYSTVFGPYKAALDRLKTENESLAQFFDTGYQVWIGYHAILQENGKKDPTVELDDDAMEELLERDRTRVAQMQVKQAIQTARLREELMKAKSQVTAEQ